jgi:7-keto-8-aminopelargonate synthetase-like enzyme
MGTIVALGESMSKRVELVHETARRLRAAGIFHRVADNRYVEGRFIALDGRKLKNFGSCSYLGLEREPRLVQAAYEAMLVCGTQFSSSRAYVSAPQYEELQALLTRIVGGQPVVIGSTTTLLHAAALPVLVEAGDIVLYDAQVHNSVQSVLPTLAAAGARIESVAHNDLDAVERVVKAAGQRVFYLCDAVYSMYGDCVPVEDLFALLDRRQNLWAYVDDAHGFGWAGRNGAGIVIGEHGLHERMFVAFGLSKGMAATGAFLACPTAALADRVFSVGSTMIFSGPIVPAALGAAIAGARILLSDELPALQARLAERVATFDEAAATHGLSVPLGRTPLKYLKIGAPEDAIAACRGAFDDGFFTNVAVYPAVPRDGAGIRVLFNVHQTLDDVRGVVKSLAAALGH